MRNNDLRFGYGHASVRYGQRHNLYLTSTSRYLTNTYKSDFELKSVCRWFTIRDMSVIKG